MKAKILLAEDDTALSFVIKDNLTDAGYDVTTSHDGEAAWVEYQKKQFDLCLLDVNMPRRDGFSLAQKIRQLSDMVPILFITAKGLEDDRIKGFTVGADDYITKPFNMQELIMRIEVFLRRSRPLQSDVKNDIRLGRFTFVYNELKLFDGEEVISLTQKEADLLKFLAIHRNKILKREEVLRHVWGKDDYFLGRSMDVFITKLRKHFKADPSINIETVHGVGFRLND